MVSLSSTIPADEVRDIASRVVRAGALRGRPRLARHLWRTCFALFIAAGSFFSIEERVANVLPEPFTSGPMRAAVGRP